jgi:hypothetical protein
MALHPVRLWVSCGVLIVSALCRPAISLVRADDKAAPDDKSQRAQAVRFLKEHLIGKTLEQPTTVRKNVGGKVESEFSLKRSYQNLKETKLSFAFEEVLDIRQTLYDLDAQGNRAGEGVKKDRRLVRRYQIGERISTGKLVGVASNAVDQDEDTPVGAFAIRMKCEDGKLEWTESTVLYSDVYDNAKGDVRRPGASEAFRVFALVDGKVECRFKGRGFEVNPDTLERTASQDYPEVILKQAD